MEPQTSDDLKLAAHLVKPFMLPGKTGQPLSLRFLEDGGLVVIASDGRKMWFTVNEVNKARRELGMTPARPQKGVKPVLQDLSLRTQLGIPFHPVTSDDKADLPHLFLPPDQEYIKDRVREQLHYFENTYKKKSRRP